MEMGSVSVLVARGEQHLHRHRLLRGDSGSGMSGSRCTPSSTIGVPSEMARWTSASMPGARSWAWRRKPATVPDAIVAVGPQRGGDVERGVVDGGHEVVGEECAHHLPELVGGDHARDPEAARELRRDGRLADPGHAPDQHQQRAVEPWQAPPLAEPLDHLLALLAGEHLLGDHA